MKILVAEDSRTQALDIQRRLQALAHDVVVAESGEEAWRVLHDCPIRIVLSDWVMPGLSGLDLCRKIRSEWKGSYIHFILLTAKSLRHERLEGLDAGADDFLSKPVDQKELQIALKTAKRLLEAQDALSERADALERLSSHDEATGLLNARGFRRALSQAIAEFSGGFLPVSLVTLGLHDWEATSSNMTLSEHSRLLRSIGNLISDASALAEQNPARLEADRFGILLPGRSADVALAIAAGAVDSLKTLKVPWGTLRVSAGVDTIQPEDPSSGDRLLEGASRALEQAMIDPARQVVHREELAGV